MKFTRGDRTPTGLFARRDASFYRNPNVDSVKRMHAMDADGGSACGIPMLDESTAKPALQVGVLSVCNREACFRRWRDV